MLTSPITEEDLKANIIFHEVPLFETELTRLDHMVPLPEQYMIHSASMTAKATV